MLRNSHFLMVTLVLILGATWMNAQTPGNDQRLVSYARSVDVSKLDPSLRQERLDVWIRSLIGSSPQQWKVEDCGERIGNETYDADPPICGKLFSRLSDGRELKLWVAIATHKTGTKAPPVLWLAYFGVPGQELPAAKLSYLPDLIGGVIGRQRIS